MQKTRERERVEWKGMEEEEEEEAEEEKTSQIKEAVTVNS